MPEGQLRDENAASVVQVSWDMLAPEFRLSHLWPDEARDQWQVRG